MASTVINSGQYDGVGGSGSDGDDFLPVVELNFMLDTVCYVGGVRLSLLACTCTMCFQYTCIDR